MITASSSGTQWKRYRLWVACLMFEFWLWTYHFPEETKVMTEILILKALYQVFSSVQSLSRVQLFATPWTKARQASLSITNSWSLLKLMSIESVIPSNHLLPVVPFSSHLQSFPASGSFQMSQLFASGGQSIRVSASVSVLPMNIQDWFPLGWTGWISLQSKGLSRVFSSTTVQKHQFFEAQLFYSLSLISIYDYWKNDSLN